MTVHPGDQSGFPRAHEPYPVEVLVMDTTDDMVILPGTARSEIQVRCGCTEALQYDYGHADD